MNLNTEKSSYQDRNFPVIVRNELSMCSFFFLAFFSPFHTRDNTYLATGMAHTGCLRIWHSSPQDMNNSRHLTPPIVSER